MAIEQFLPYAYYVGENNNDEYSFDFKIARKEDLEVVIRDTDGEEVCRVRGTDTTFLAGVQFSPTRGGGEVTLAEDLATGYELWLFLKADQPTQPTKLRDAHDFSLPNFEQALDFMMAPIISLAYLMARTLKLPDTFDVTGFDTQFPDPTGQNYRILTLNSTANGFAYGPTVNEIEALVASAAGSADDAAAAKGYAEAAQAAAEAAAAAAEEAAGSVTPTGGAEGDLIEQDAMGDMAWGNYGVVGFSARFNILVNAATFREAWNLLWNLQYTAPTISLSGSSNTLREKGDSVAAVTLTAAIGLRSNPIGEVRFYRQSPSAALLDTQTSGGGIPSGGNSTYNYGTAFSDNITFRAEVDDIAQDGNGPSTSSSTTTYSFVYPYYYGSGAAGLGAGVSALTKDIIASNANLTRSFSPNGSQKMYFAYPASYGALTAIFDVNNFDTIGDWTLTTANITGLDGNAVSYRIYEFNNVAVAGTYPYRFVR